MRFIPISISIMFLTACYQTESSLTNTLIYCADKAPVTLNPQISSDVASLDATTHQLYNRLVKIDPISQRFIPDIAIDWEVNEQKTQYTFSLRDDVNFHHTDYFTPTRQLNADDVVYSFKRMLSEEHPYHTVNSNAYSYLYNHPFSNLVSDIVKIDDNTVRFLLNKPDATLLANLAAHYAVIHSKEYAVKLLQEGHPEQLDFQPIGSGPYQFKHSNNNRIFRYQAHKSPWQLPVTIDSLIFDITPNASKRYAKLISGECDIISAPASSQVKQISHNPNVSLSSQPTGNISYIGFNTQKPPFSDLATRHALSTAIDQKTILDAVFFDSGIATQTLLPEQSWAYNPRTKKVLYDPQKSQLGLIKGHFDFTKTLRILAPINNSIFNPNYYKTAELIQSNWADLGVQSEIVRLRETELQSALLNGEYDIYLSGNSPYITDPDNLFRPLVSCNSTPLEGNTSQWCNSSTQDLLDDTLLEENFIQRVKNYYQLQEEMQEQRLYLPLAHLLRFDVFNKNISGVEVDPLTGINFHLVKKVAPVESTRGR